MATMTQSERIEELESIRDELKALCKRLRLAIAGTSSEEHDTAYVVRPLQELVSNSNPYDYSLRTMIEAVECGDDEDCK